MKSRATIERLIYGTAISISLSMWLFALNRNLSIPYIGDSLGYVSRARNMADLGIMNHAPIEPFGVPIQSMGYSLILNFLPAGLLANDHLLRIVVSVVQFVVYLIGCWLLSTTVSRLSSFRKDTLFLALCLYWPAIIISTEVMSDSISLSIHLIILSLLIRTISTKFTAKMGLYLGLSFGLLLIIRPSSLMISPVIVVCILISVKNRSSFKGVTSGMAIFLFTTLLIVSPQLVWTHQQFNTISIIELDDSYTNGIAISELEQNARATYIQLNGCGPSVDCESINRYPGPISWRSYEALKSSTPRWDNWLFVEPGFAMAQASLILLASLDQEFYFTYINEPGSESNFLALFLMLLLLLSGIKYMFSELRVKQNFNRDVTLTFLLVAAPYLISQFFLFHAENRYGLVPGAILFTLGAISYTHFRSVTSLAREIVPISLLAAPITILSWETFVSPFVN
jgi:hypothetical protein